MEKREGAPIKEKIKIVTDYVEEHKDAISFYKKGDPLRKFKDMPDDLNKTISMFNKAYRIENTKEIGKAIAELLDNHEYKGGNSLLMTPTIKEELNTIGQRILVEQKKKDLAKTLIEEQQNQAEIEKRNEVQAELNEEKIKENIFSNDHKTNIIEMGLDTQRHINMVVEAILNDDEIMDILFRKTTIEGAKKHITPYERSYTKEEQEEMKNIKNWFLEKVSKKTNITVAIDEIYKIDENVITKNPQEKITITKDNKDEIIIKIDRKSYGKIKDNNSFTEQLIKKNNIGLRGRIFDRIVEYIELEILQESLKQVNESVIVKKSSRSDDCMEGIDFGIKFTNSKNKSEIFFIDAVVSDNKGKIKEKIEKSKKETIPYIYIIDEVIEQYKHSNKKVKTYFFPRIKKIVEVFEPYMTYFILTHALKKIEAGKDHKKFIKGLFVNKMDSEDILFCKEKIEESIMTKEKIHKADTKLKERIDNIIRTSRNKTAEQKAQIESNSIIIKEIDI